MTVKAPFALSVNHGDLARIVDDVDTGARRPDGTIGKALFLSALAWALFQLYIASPLPFLLGVRFGYGFVVDEIRARLIHYTFAIVLAFCIYPAHKRSSRTSIPIADWAMAAVAGFGALYIFIYFDELARRAANPTQLDIVIACVGVLGLLEATRRTIGAPLTIVAAVFIAYGFAGPYLPDLLAHRGNSWGRMADHLWLSTEGVFGITLGVSTNLVFLFVMFGSLLERAGAGNYFIKISMALFGHLRGGPAKAAVVSSAMTGVVSGSALANVVTTGTFTIPLMKRVGFPAEKAAGIESSSSINGQLMPPVMGAAAFIMTEFVGIDYAAVIKHAFLPAVISYIGLFYIVHLEAVKMNLRVLERRATSPLLHKLTRFGLAGAGLVILTGIVVLGIGWIKVAAGAASGPIVFALLGLAYVGLLWVSSRVPELQHEDPGIPMEALPQTAPTLLAGLHYLLPIAVLVWFLMVERFSPSLSVSWAVVALIFVMLTQHPILMFFRGSRSYADAIRRGLVDVIQGMVAGARNMVGVAVALAAAGIVVGIVTLTGLGPMMLNVIEVFSGGNLLAMLFFTAVISIILGMGLPTTANYVVVASLMAPVVVTLAAQGGLVVPLIAVHLFVFYCGLMSGNTPPVAVDAYAAAALAGADPLRTCIHAFYYSLRTMILPFIFIFNTELLMIGITGWLHFLMTMVVSVTAMLVFVAATQGYMLTRSRAYESVGLLLVAFVLLVPGFWIDRVYPPFTQAEPTSIERIAEDIPDNGLLRIWVEGEGFGGGSVSKVVILPLGPAGGSGFERLTNASGITLSTHGDRVVVDSVRAGSPADLEGISFDSEVRTLEIPAIRPRKEWVYIPALLMLAGIAWLQMGRRRRLATVLVS